MGLQLSISAKEQKDSISVYDCTGAYSSSNQGGYSGPNPRPSNATEAVLLIKTPSSKEEITVDVYPTLPNSEEVPFEVLPYQLGMKEIESGRYDIKYVVKFKDANGSVQEKTAYFVLICIKSIVCCVDKKMKFVRAGGQKDPKQLLAIELNNLLEGVKYQIDCGNYETVNEDIEYLKAQCNCCGCN